MFDDTEISRLLFDLKTIAKYKCGEVIDTTNNSISVSENSYSKAVGRRMTGDDRYKALERFKHLIMMAFEYAGILCESKYMTIYAVICRQVVVDEFTAYEVRFNIIKNIRMCIRDACGGIREFMANYEMKNDTTIVSDCVILLKLIATKLAALNATIAELESQHSRYIQVND